MTRLELLEIAKPIPFNDEMVRAIQNHNKTVTRRKVKPQPPKEANGIYERMDNGNFQMKVAPYEDIYDYEIIPPYQVGDYLYVRETWATTKSNACIANELGNCPHKSCDTADGTCFADEYIYKADDLLRTDVKWHPSIHMPKEAARIFLRVTDVRVERLQDITEEQAIHEGIEPHMLLSNRAGTITEYRIPGTCDECPTARGAFFHLWNSTVKKSDLDKYGWDANPWVLVVEFEKVEVE